MRDDAGVRGPGERVVDVLAGAHDDTPEQVRRLWEVVAVLESAAGRSVRPAGVSTDIAPLSVAKAELDRAHAAIMERDALAAQFGVLVAAADEEGRKQRGWWVLLAAVVAIIVIVAIGQLL